MNHPGMRRRPIRRRPMRRLRMPPPFGAPRTDARAGHGRSLPPRSALATAAIVALAAALMAGCADQRHPEEPRRDIPQVYDLSFTTPKFEPPRRLDTLMAVDLDGSGRVEYIVTSILDTGMVIPGTRADMIQIYRFDTAARGYRPVVQDEILGATELKLRDLTGDRVPELIVPLNSGGNDPIASNGVNIYSGAGGAIRPIFQATHGDPTFTEIPGIGSAILLQDELWPSFASHAEAEPYPSDIFAVRNGRYISVRHEARGFLMKKADEQLARYRSARDSVAADTTVSYESGMALFSPAALTILLLQEAEARASLRSFWSSERDFLRSRMLDYQYDELESIYGRAVNA